MTLDRKDEDASRMLAVKAVCACEGRSNPRPRAHLDGGGTEDWVEGNFATGVDSTGVAGKDDNGQCKESAQSSSSLGFCRLETWRVVRFSNAHRTLRHSAGVGDEQQIQDEAGELTFLWTETEQPAALM
jgi:hypothetical protein